MAPPKNLAVRKLHSLPLLSSDSGGGVSLIGARVLDSPGFLALTVAGFIARSENQDVALIIDALR